MTDFNVDVKALVQLELLEPVDEPKTWPELLHLWFKQERAQLIMYDYDENENEGFYASVLRQAKHGCEGKLPISRAYSTFENDETITRVHYRLHEKTDHTKDFECEGSFVGEDLSEWVASLVEQYTDCRVINPNFSEDGYTTLFILPRQALL